MPSALAPRDGRDTNSSESVTVRARCHMVSGPPVMRAAVLTTVYRRDAPAGADKREMGNGELIGFLGLLKLGVFFPETLDAAGGVDQFLLACEKRMAL